MKKITLFFIAFLIYAFIASAEEFTAIVWYTNGTNPVNPMLNYDPSTFKYFAQTFNLSLGSTINQVFLVVGAITTSAPPGIDGFYILGTTGGVPDITKILVNVTYHSSKAIHVGNNSFRFDDVYLPADTYAIVLKGNSTTFSTNSYFSGTTSNFNPNVSSIPAKYSATGNAASWTTIGGGYTWNFIVGYNSSKGTQIVYDDKVVTNKETTIKLHAFRNMLNATYTSSVFFYNGTAYPALKTSNDTTDTYTVTLTTPMTNTTTTFSFYFNLSITLENGSVTSMLVEGNQTVLSPEIYNCTTNSVINITVMNYATKNWANATSKILITINDIPYNFSITKDNFGFCININNTYTAKIHALYYAIGFNTNEYIETLTVNNDTIHQLSWYLHNSTSVSQITIYVRDDKGSGLEGYALETQEYDLSKNEYVTTEQHRTGMSGKTINSLVLNSKYYRWIVRDVSGKTVLITNKQIITDTNNIYITVPSSASSITESLMTITGVSHTLTNTSRTIVFTWVDNQKAGNNYCIVDLNTTTRKIINSECSSDWFGTLTYQATENRTYSIISTITIANTTYVLSTLDLDFRNEKMDFSLLGLFFALSVIMIVIVISKSPSMMIITTTTTLMILSGAGIIKVSTSAVIGLVVLAIAALVSTRT